MPPDTFLAQPKPIRLQTRLQDSTTLMELLFFCKLKITYLSNQEHSSSIFALSATKSSTSSNPSSSLVFY